MLFRHSAAHYAPLLLQRFLCIALGTAGQRPKGKHAATIPRASAAPAFDHPDVKKHEFLSHIDTPANAMLFACQHPKPADNDALVNKALMVLEEEVKGLAGADATVLRAGKARLKRLCIHSCPCNEIALQRHATAGTTN